MIKQELNTSRRDGRENHQLRSLKISTDLYGYAAASVLLELGSTKVLACISLQSGVPQFLKGHKVGWLTAEYAMLPCSTRQRTLRDSLQAKANPRSQEISRLIGRSFRSITDLNLLPEKTIHIDCEVLQADGGTRVACITAASLALSIATKRWLRDGIITQNLMKEAVTAVSVGLVEGQVLLDITQEEDNAVTADWNFVITKSSKIIEIQGTAEKEPISHQEFDALKDLGIKGALELLEKAEALLFQDHSMKKLFEANPGNSTVNAQKTDKPANFFSIGARFSN